MTKMTKAQLVDENIALRHNIGVLEQQVAALRAERIVRSTTPQRPSFVERIVSTYTKRDGSRWNKVQIGWNSYAHRPAN